MRLLFDQNISHRILALLPEEFSGSTTVKNEGLINALDIEIWEYSKNNDFTGNLKTKAILEILIEYYSELKKFESDNKLGCFEIMKLK